MSAETTHAIVIRAVDYSETSKVVTFFTERFGKLSVLAKGGRRLKSQFEVALDLLSVCSISVIRKSSGGLDILTEAVLVERFAKLRENLSALYAAYFIAEILEGLTQPADPHSALYYSTIETLRLLGGDYSAAGVDSGSDEERLKRIAWFILALLRETGFSPSLDQCCVCGNEIQASTNVSYGVSTGGVICMHCMARVPKVGSVSGAALQSLKFLAQNPLHSLPRLSLSDRSRREVWNILGAHIAHQMGRAPRTAPMIESLFRPARRG